MNKILLAILTVGFLGAAAQAQTGWNWDSEAYYGQSTPSVADSHQDYYDQGTQIPVYNVDPSVCYEPGWDFGGYFSAMFPTDSTRANGIGGGVSLSYFFDRNIGIELNYSLHGQGEAQNVVHANAIYRLPINGCFCASFQRPQTKNSPTIRAFSTRSSSCLMKELRYQIEGDFSSTASLANYSSNWKRLRRVI